VINDTPRENVNPVAAAGWYPDPELAHTQRYWNGAQWLDHRAPLGGGPQPSRAPSHPQPAPPFPRRFALGWAAGMLCVLVLVFVCQLIGLSAVSNLLWSVGLIIGILTAVSRLVIWLVKLVVSAL
jgi:hypothetical protein